jgi:hypothetical protein
MSASASTPTIVIGIVTVVIAGLALAISVLTAAKTFLTRFSGQAWPGTRFVLSHVSDVPSMGLACSFENPGAKPGALDDLRLVIKHNEGSTTSHFFAVQMRDDYNLFALDKETGWYPFNGVTLSGRQRIDRSVLFVPRSREFKPPEGGSFEVILESRRYGEKRWRSSRLKRHFDLAKDYADAWSKPNSSPIAVLCKELTDSRNVW